MAVGLPGERTGAEGANLARRNQMKLSGKRTLPRMELWKVRAATAERYRRCNASVVSTSTLRAGASVQADKRGFTQPAMRISQVTLQRRAILFVRLLRLIAKQFSEGAKPHECTCESVVYKIR